MQDTENFSWNFFLLWNPKFVTTRKNNSSNPYRGKDAFLPHSYNTLLQSVCCYFPRKWSICLPALGQTSYIHCC